LAFLYFLVLWALLVQMRASFQSVEKKPFFEGALEERKWDVKKR